MNLSQGASQAASNNVTNASTVGYTRRATDINPTEAGKGSFTSARVVEPFIQKKMLSAQSSSAEADASRGAVDVLDQVYSEGDGTLSSSVDAFEVAIQNLSSSPSDTATRQTVLSAAGQLSTAFNNASASISQAKSDANTQITAGVQQVNDALTQIGQLGVKIQQAELGGTEASDLRDQRDQLLNQVAKQVPITTLDQGGGQMTVLLGGSQQLVGPDGTVSQLSVAPGDDGNLKITKVVAGQTTDVTPLVASGAIGGLLKTTSGTLTDAQNQLDTLAYNVANAYNAAHSAGYAQDGTTGKNLFTPPASISGAAAKFAVSADVAGQPQNIATASDSSAQPSDNGNALALSAVASAPLAIGGGMTVSEALASMVSAAGFAVQGATSQQSFAAGALQQVQSLSDSVSGVSSDDEMVSLMQYQRTYQASLKVISTADQMLSDLITMMGT